MNTSRVCGAHTSSPIALTPRYVRRRTETPAACAARRGYGTTAPGLHYNERMKLRAIFVLTMGLFIAALSLGVARAEQTKSVWDGVYTAEQAARGAETYKAVCSECHGGDLMGDGFAPPLAGADFQGNWNDLSVGYFFERIRISMPPSNPASVTPQQKADIVAHLMSQNKFPAGAGQLEPKTDVLKMIKIDQKK